MVAVSGNSNQHFCHLVSVIFIYNQQSKIIYQNIKDQINDYLPNTKTLKIL